MNDLIIYLIYVMIFNKVLKSYNQLQKKTKDNGQAPKKKYWEAKIQRRGEVTFLGLFREKDSERGRHWKKEVIRREIKREG